MAILPPFPIDEPISQYSTLYDAYSFFNRELFDNALPAVLITTQHSTKFHGYYSNDRFHHDGTTLDELCMNPDTFDRPHTEILSTLVHEMCHVWQQHFGKPSRKAYHNQEWANKMLAIGLKPFNVKSPARMTGQSVSHTVVSGGAFELHCKTFLSKPFGLFFSKDDIPDKKKKTPSKVKFTCPHCDQNVWAKPTASVICGTCFEYDERTAFMVPEPLEPADE